MKKKVQTGKKEKKQREALVRTRKLQATATGARINQGTPQATEGKFNRAGGLKRGKSAKKRGMNPGRPTGR